MKKTLLQVIAYFGMIGVIAGGIYWLGGFVKTTSDGILTPKQKNDILETIYTLPTSLENYKRQLKMDSVDIKIAKGVDHTMKSRDKRDSAVLKALDIGQRNAVQISQIKQRQDTIIKLLKK